MNTWREYLVMGLIVGLLHLTLADIAMSGDRTGLPAPALTRQQVSQFGVGANVKVGLFSGKKLKGSIQSVEEGGFVLASNPGGSPTRVAYDQVSNLRLAKLTFNSKGQPNAAEAKRVAAGLGVGHHIVVKTAQGREYHGNIVALDADSLTLQPDHATAPVQVAYDSVQQMGPNPGAGTWVAIGVLAAVVALVVVIVVIKTNMG